MAWPETPGLTSEDLGPGSYWNQVLEVMNNVNAFADQFKFLRCEKCKPVVYCVPLVMSDPLTHDSCAAGLLVCER